MKHQEEDQTPNCVNIICIQWGTLYGAEYVNRLYSMILNNTTLPIKFHLFSNEELSNLNKNIIQLPEPGIKIPKAYKNYNYRRSAGFCDNNLGGLNGQRVFSFDLDVLIMSNLDDLFKYPKDDNFYIINDWNTKGNHVGQGTCYSFVVGTLGFIKEHFEANPEKVLKEFGSATQQYLSAKIIEKFGQLNFWPEAWFQSFKYHCLPKPFLRHFLTPKKPKLGTKLLAFHGNPNLEDAIIGRWAAPTAKKPATGLKKFYKTCRPTPWIVEIWKRAE